MDIRKLSAIVVALLVLLIPVIGCKPEPVTSPQTTYSLTISTVGNGSTSPSVGTTTYNAGTEVTITATPDSGWQFGHWTGDASGNSATVTVTMNSNKVVTANFTSLSSTVSPNLTVALDYFGIRNTLWTSQIGGEDYARVQVVLVIKDDQQNLATLSLPPEPSAGYLMDFFQVNELKKNRSPNVFTGHVDGSLTVFIAAYNVSKGLVTQNQIDILSQWTGADLSILKSMVPDRELVGSYWHTWSPSENWGIGGNYDGGDEGLTVWLRIGSDGTMPDPVAYPVLKPNVGIVGTLPTDAKARTYGVYNSSNFAFTVTNHEAFDFTIYWRLETDSNPGTTINFIIYATEGYIDVPGGGSRTVTNPYWFTTPGTYQWKYVVEYPKNNPVASWEGTLTVAP